MLSFMDHLIIGFRLRAVKAAEKWRDESGVSSFVATVLLIVIVVSLTAVFWEGISKWFTEMWNKIVDNSNQIGN